jgi:general secretion pathway protein G
MPFIARGYTLIELLVVMAVLGILATAAMPLVELTARRNKERELKQSVWEIRRAIDAYKQAYDEGRIPNVSGASGYPPSLSVLASGVPDVGSGGSPMYFLRRIPKDPFAKKELSAEQSWAIRSYQSPPELPTPGLDVFDVYSFSEERGFNGVPYRQW